MKSLFFHLRCLFNLKGRMQSDQDKYEAVTLRSDIKYTVKYYKDFTIFSISDSSS